MAFPSLLTGAAGSNGNMRGSAAVVLAVGVPALTATMIGAARGSARAFVFWLGTLGYLLYQAVLFCFATPYNNLFLIYETYFGLAVWSIVLLRSTDLRAFGLRVSPRAPIRVVAGFALVVVVLNTVAWLAGIVPTVLSDHHGKFLTETGMLTNPVYIQDLAVWLPLLATAAVAAWRHQVWGQTQRPVDRVHVLGQGPPIGPGAHDPEAARHPQSLANGAADVKLSRHVRLRDRDGVPGPALPTSGARGRGRGLVDNSAWTLRNLLPRAHRCPQPRRRRPTHRMRDSQPGPSCPVSSPFSQ